MDAKAEEVSLVKKIKINNSKNPFIVVKWSHNNSEALKKHEKYEKILGMLIIKFHAEKYSRKPIWKFGKNEGGIRQPIEDKPKVKEGANKVEEQILMEMENYNYNDSNVKIHSMQKPRRNGRKSC